MESFDAGGEPEAGQAPEHEVGGEAPQGPDPNAIADTLYDELTQGYGDEGDEYQEEEDERPTIGQIAADQRDQGTLLAGLVEQHPGIQTPQAIDAMGPIYEQVIAEYPELQGDPEAIRAIYNELGGDERFASALVAQDYAQVFPNESTAFRDETGKVVRTDPLTS